MDDSPRPDALLASYGKSFRSLSREDHDRISNWLHDLQSHNLASSSEKCSARILLSTIQRFPIRETGSRQDVPVPEKKAKLWKTWLTKKFVIYQAPEDVVENKLEPISLTEAFKRIGEANDNPRLLSLEAMKFVISNDKNLDDVAIFMSVFSVELYGTRAAAAVLRAASPYCHPRYKDRAVLRHAWKELRDATIGAILKSNDKPERLLKGMLHDL